jgi:hypothetical protein
MKKTTTILAKFSYAVFGTLFLAGGAGVLLIKTGLLPGPLEETLADFGRGDLNTLHVMQEFGSLLVFAGLITFWFLRHYEESKAFHWSLTTFWALFALVHWFDVRKSLEAIAGPLINTVPFILFLVVGLLRTAADGRRA